MPLYESFHLRAPFVRSVDCIIGGIRNRGF